MPECDTFQILSHFVTFWNKSECNFVQNTVVLQGKLRPMWSSAISRWLGICISRYQVITFFLEIWNLNRIRVNSLQHPACCFSLETVYQPFSLNQQKCSNHSHCSNGTFFLSSTKYVSNCLNRTRTYSTNGKKYKKYRNFVDSRIK